MKLITALMSTLLALTLLLSLDQRPAVGERLDQPNGIAGLITSTLTLTQDSQLSGDVTCQVNGRPCIELAAPGITLRLMGFTIRGPAEPPSACAPTNAVPEDGIAVVGQEGVAILGPGGLQTFRRHGIFVNQSSSMIVSQVTSSTNCYSGILLSAVSDSDFTDNVSVGNAIASGVSPCGGTCIVNSNDNRFRGNVYGGNGSVEPENNDFGLGLIGTSSNNLVEENLIVGNTNGVLLQAGAAGNLIRGNTIVGNPPAQVSASYGNGIGADIRNLSASGANVFEDNVCLTYFGPEPAPCPST